MRPRQLPQGAKLENISILFGSFLVVPSLSLGNSRLSNSGYQQPLRASLPTVIESAASRGTRGSFENELWAEVGVT